MPSRSGAAVVLAASALLLSACLEADVQTEVRADGSGTLGVGMKFTDKFVEIIRKLEKSDSKQDIVLKSKEGMMKKPDEALIAAWEKKGLKVVQFENVADEKRISSTVKFEFKSLDLLRSLEEIKQKDGGTPVGALSLTRDDKGVYTLAMGSPETGKPSSRKAAMDPGEDPEVEKPAGKDGEKPEAKDPEAEAKKAEMAMAMMGEMMEEVKNFKFSVSMKVPGEVVDFEPATGGKKDGGKVTWEFSLESLMQSQTAEGDGEDGGKGSYKVRFRMPEGQSIPESALTKAAAPAPEGAK
jgi:hypothetical protein